MDTATTHEMSGFSLGVPTLVCRWRLSDGKLALANRHFRALSKRQLNGKPVSPELVAWVKQHVEWSLKAASTTEPNGVLMLIVDDMGKAALTVGPYQELKQTSLSALLIRAENSIDEAKKTGVAPETIACIHEGVLRYQLIEGAQASGATTFTSDLANSLGMSIIREKSLALELRSGVHHKGEVFLISDEYGIVPAQDKSAAVAERFAQSYEKLLASMRS